MGAPAPNNEGPARIAIRREDIDSREARALTNALAAEVAALYDDDSPTEPIPAGEVAGGRGAFLVASIGDADVGCGAVRRLYGPSLEDTAELKRMYVVPAARRSGVGRALLAALEAEASHLAVARIVLETGHLQPAAIAMYTAAGYTPIERYVPWTHPESVLLGKRLVRQ